MHCCQGRLFFFFPDFLTNEFFAHFKLVTFGNFQNTLKTSFQGTYFYSSSLYKRMSDCTRDHVVTLGHPRPGSARAVGEAV